MPVIKSLYNRLHALLNRNLDVLPFFSKKYLSKPILKGHISSEHLQNPELDTQLVEDLRKTGIKVEKYWIDIEGYRSYIKSIEYPISYYGGGKDSKQNFIEKSLEHFVSLSFLPLSSSNVFMDIAAATSPFSEIVKKKFNVKASYKQDLIFPSGVNGNTVGGNAAHISLPDASVDGATLHCSLEHFEGDSDSLFFQEMERILKRGGALVVLPFYLAYEYTNHVDPVFNLLRGHRVKLDTDPRVQLRYATWKQFFSRHYDPIALQERVISKTKNLELTIYHVQNFEDVDCSCYLRFIGVFTKI